MAKVICQMNCKHRSKRPMRNYKFKSGGRCYGCTLDAITILRIFDPDDYVVHAVGEENMGSCIHYEPIDEDEDICSV